MYEFTKKYNFFVKEASGEKVVFLQFREGGGENFQKGKEENKYD